MFEKPTRCLLALIDGKQYIAIQTTQGIQFWDFTDPPNAVRIGNIDLPGVNGGDYEGRGLADELAGAVPGRGGRQPRGIYVVDMSDPVHPGASEASPDERDRRVPGGTVVRARRLPRDRQHGSGRRVSVLDISVPDDPALARPARELAAHVRHYRGRERSHLYRGSRR